MYFLIFKKLIDDQYIDIDPSAIKLGNNNQQSHGVDFFPPY